MTAALTHGTWWNSKLRQVDCNALAAQTLAVRRRRKLTPRALITSFASMVAHAAPSLAATAIVLGCVGGKVVSKQAVAKKTSPRLADFFAAVLASFTTRVLVARAAQLRTIFKRFDHVWVQDSTTVPLPLELLQRYPGGKNNRGEAVATLKVQATLDLKTERFGAVSITPFCRNDQAASADILAIVRAGDLVIRDLGYWALGVFKQIVDRGAFIVSRYCHSTHLYQPGSTERFALASYLRKHGMLDRPMLLGAHKLPLRFVAIPLPPAVAEKRRRELRHNRDKRLKPSKERMLLCGWALFVTNIDPQTCCAAHIAHIYGLRWRIETVFKAWKSTMGLKNLPSRCSAYYTECLILSRLLLILLIHAALWVPLIQRLCNTCSSTPPLSLIKFYKLLDILIRTPLFLANPTASATLAVLHRHCRYEKRRRVPHLLKLADIPHHGALS